MGGFTPVAFGRFPGLDLRTDPEESSCVDNYNVDLATPGMVKTRDGLASFATLAFSGLPVMHGFSTTSPGDALAVSNPSSSSTYIYDNLGALVSTTVASNAGNFAQLGTPTLERLYFVGTAGLFYWDSTGVFGGPQATAPAGRYVGVQPTEGRLIIASPTTHRVQFSAAGDATTWPANNYVTLTPGDGEQIQGVVTWRDLVFVFKRTKFFVFYGNSVDASGNSIFNYRTVDAGVGLTAGPSCVATPGGVYFAAEPGIFLTTGGPPQKVSGVLDPWFSDTISGSLLFGEGTPPSAFGSAGTRLAWVDDRLVVTSDVSGVGTAVYWPQADAWARWSFSGRIAGWDHNHDGNTDVFYVPRFSSSLLRQAPGQTTDNANPIISRWRSGFYTLGDEREKTIRETLVWGTGTIDVQMARNFGPLDLAASVVLAGGVGRRRTAVRGSTFSHRIGASSGQWSAQKVVQHVRGRSRPAGEHT